MLKVGRDEKTQFADFSRWPKYYGVFQRRVLDYLHSSGDAPVSQIGSGRAAGAIVGDLKATIAKAMDAARQKIAAATTELTAEINDGSAAVESALHREILAVRQEFGEVIGNGPEVADTEAMVETKTETAKANGLFPAPGTPAAGG